jgi:acyl-coenzyme A thioesterase PaaI-like protein
MKGRPATYTEESPRWCSTTSLAPRKQSGEARLTGTITLRYLRLTRLGELHAEARITRTDGVKTYTAGHLADDEGVTVEAEGVFIQPRWARG